MTNDEINKRIATEIMGICTTHVDMSQYGAQRLICPDCGTNAPGHYYHQYCNDNSPRRLLNEVITAVITKPSMYKFWSNLQHTRSTQGFMTAEQIATALLYIHQNIAVYEEMSEEAFGITGGWTVFGDVDIQQFATSRRATDGPQFVGVIALGHESAADGPTPSPILADGEFTEFVFALKQLEGFAGFSGSSQEVILQIEFLEFKR